MKLICCSVLIAIVFLVACDGGLSLPPDIQPGITGTLTVQGAWPPPDSIQTLWIFASQIFPIDSAKVVTGILENKIHLYPAIDQSLPYNFRTQTFNFALPPGTYYYIGVLQRFGSSLVDPKSYKVVGVYTDPGNPLQPLTVQVKELEVVPGIDMTVDFYNLPPQPF
jgi:hypothetical protein